MTSKKIYYTSSREMLYESTCKDSYICQYCDADVWYEGGDKDEALRISRKFAADTYDTGKVEICKNGVARNVFEVCETLLDEDGDVVGEDTIEIVDPLDRMPKLRELADKADSIHCQLPSYITGECKQVDDVKINGIWSSTPRPGIQRGRRSASVRIPRLSACLALSSVVPSGPPDRRDTTRPTEWASELWLRTFVVPTGRDSGPASARGAMTIDSATS